MYEHSHRIIKIFVYVGCYQSIIYAYNSSVSVVRGSIHRYIGFYVYVYYIFNNIYIFCFVIFFIVDLDLR